MDSPEYKTLAQFYPALVSCVGQAPVNIAVQLIPYGILAPRDVQYLSNPSIVDNEKARRLLGIVVNQMKTDPQVYHTFIAALKDAGDWTRTLVSLLEQAYARWMQSSNADVHSTEELGESLAVVFCYLYTYLWSFSLHRVYMYVHVNDTLLRFTTRQHFWDTIDSG